MEPKVVISFQDASNKIAAEIDRNNKNFDAIVEQIKEITTSITDPSISAQQKYDSIVSIEYLLVRARIDSEFEHLKIKQLLSDQNTPASLRGIFMKRAQYLAEIGLKLNSIRDDIAVLQKSVYTQQSRSFMK